MSNLVVRRIWGRWSGRIAACNIRGRPARRARLLGSASNGIASGIRSSRFVQTAFYRADGCVLYLGHFGERIFADIKQSDVFSLRLAQAISAEISPVEVKPGALKDFTFFRT